VILKVNNLILERFPELNLGVVIANQIDNRGRSDEIMHMIRDRENEIRAQYSTETLFQEPKIESWRRAYSSFGAKPKKYKSSVESLYRMILKGVDLRPINKIVDVYNFISIKHMVPAGGDDTQKVDGNIILRFAAEGEPFTALHSEEIERTKEGEVVYADDREVLCRRWNWRECDKTKMTEDTEDVILVVEGLPPVIPDEMSVILEEFKQLIEKHCVGKIRTVILDDSRPEVEI
jgi:lysyl-tRNA synthetase class 2